MLVFGYSWGALVFMVQLILLMTLMHRWVAWPINFRTNRNKILQPETWPFLSGVMSLLSCCCLGWHNLDLQESSLACTDFEWRRAPGTYVTSAVSAGPVTEGLIPVQVVTTWNAREMSHVWNHPSFQQSVFYAYGCHLAFCFTLIKKTYKLELKKIHSI